MKTKYQIQLVYEFDGEFQVESVLAEKEGEYFRIQSIPFFAPNIALNDLVSVEIEKDGALYFDKLIEASGHSTLQIVFFNEKEISPTLETLQKLGCVWNGEALETLVNVDIPKDVSYFPIKEYLDEGEKNELLSYKEASLSHNSA